MREQQHSSSSSSILPLPTLRSSFKLAVVRVVLHLLGVAGCEHCCFGLTSLGQFPLKRQVKG